MNKHGYEMIRFCQSENCQFKFVPKRAVIIEESGRMFFHPSREIIDKFGYSWNGMRDYRRPITLHPYRENLISDIIYVCGVGCSNPRKDINNLNNAFM